MFSYSYHFIYSASPPRSHLFFLNYYSAWRRRRWRQSMPDFPASFLSFSMREKMKKKKKKKPNYLGVFGARSTQRRLLNNLKTRSSRSMFVYFSFCWLMSHVSNQKSKGKQQEKRAKIFQHPAPHFSQSISLHSSVSTDKLQNKN